MKALPLVLLLILLGTRMQMVESGRRRIFQYARKWDRILEKVLAPSADSSNRCMRMKSSESEWKEGGRPEIETAREGPKNL